MDIRYLYSGDPANHAYAIRLCKDGRLLELSEFCYNENCDHVLEIENLDAPAYKIQQTSSGFNLLWSNSGGTVSTILATYNFQH